MALFDERFSFGLGTVVGCQAVGVANVVNVTLTGLVVRTGNFRAQRILQLLFTVDGNQYELVGEFEDDTFHRQTITGGPITRAEESQ